MSDNSPLDELDDDFDMSQFTSNKDTDSNKSEQTTMYANISPDDHIKLAKAFTLRTLAFGMVLIICLCIYRTDNINETLNIIMPIIVGVLSFIAGYLAHPYTKRGNKDVKQEVKTVQEG